MTLRYPAAILLLACALSPPLAASGDNSARTLYERAMTRERAVRSADQEQATLADLRRVIRAYDSIVRRFPGSGYSDNALWQAGVLSLDAFERFGQKRDKEAGLQLLRRLVAGYPASSLVAQAREQIAHVRVDAAVATAGDRQSTHVPSPVDSSLNPSSSKGDRIATIRAIRRAVLPDTIRVTIELDGEVPFHDERIPNPDRLFVDLPGTRPAASLDNQTLRFDGDADLVRQVRLGRHPNNTTRVVLDAGGISSYSVYPLYSPYRLVIDCVRASPSASSSAPPPRATPASAMLFAPAPGLKDVSPVSAPPPPPAPLKTRRTAALSVRRAPSLSPQHGLLIAEALAPLPGPMPRPEPAARPIDASMLPQAAPPAKNANGNFSIARQLGLSVSRIVIDAGHGGHDPGAQGKGVGEAELVLDVALRLEKLLQKVPGVEVILTRRTDDFVPLQERTAIANREGADLFLSIHANASRRADARGVETYFLNFATNPDAETVAARENATSAQTMGTLPAILRAIALNSKLDESRELASIVQTHLVRKLRAQNRSVRDLGVKQAPFVVLIGAQMPSVLAEISFVTNRADAALLKQAAYRQQIAQALYDGIVKYQASLKKVTIAGQLR